jgi:hypothetical protein
MLVGPMAAADTTLEPAESPSSSPSLITTLRPVFDVVSRYGLGAVLTIYLVYKLSSQIDGRLAALEAKLDSRLRVDAVNTLLLKAICSNTAKSEYERATCLGAGE